MVIVVQNFKFVDVTILKQSEVQVERIERVQKTRVEPRRLNTRWLVQLRCVLILFLTTFVNIVKTIVLFHHEPMDLADATNISSIKWLLLISIFILEKTQCFQHTYLVIEVSQFVECIDALGLFALSINATEEATEAADVLRIREVAL